MAVNDILTSINHTTVEGLGFAHVFSCNGADIFKLKGISVSFDKIGKYSISVNDRPVAISLLSQLVELVKNKS